MEKINYWLVIGYSLIGWVVQVGSYYFKFDTDDKFDKVKFWRTYDKYIILGLISAIALGLLGDFGWPTITEKLNVNIKYDERVGIITGAFSCLIFLFASRNAHRKLEEK